MRINMKEGEQILIQKEETAGAFTLLFTKDAPVTTPPLNTKT